MICVALHHVNESISCFLYNNYLSYFSAYIIFMLDLVTYHTNCNTNTRSAEQNDSFLY